MKKRIGRPPGKSNAPYKPRGGSVADKLIILAVGQATYIEFNIEVQRPANALSAIQSVIHRSINNRANLNFIFKTELVTVIPSIVGQPVRYAVRVERLS